MKNKAKAILVVSAIVLATILTVYAAYDSSSDPLISKSYLEQVFMAAVDEKIDELRTTVGTLQTTVSSLQDQVTSLQALVLEQNETLKSQAKTIADHQTVITAHTKTIDSLNTAIFNLQNQVNNQSTAVGATFQVVHLTQGQSLICNGGSSSAVEIILRSGQAVAVSQYASTGTYAQGLSDTTASVEIYNGQNLTVNHNVIVPRGDGRGVKVTSVDAYFLVRGEYDIVG